MIIICTFSVCCYTILQGYGCRRYTIQTFCITVYCMYYFRILFSSISKLLYYFRTIVLPSSMIYVSITYYLCDQLCYRYSTCRHAQACRTCAHIIFWSLNYDCYNSVTVTSHDRAPVLTQHSQRYHYVCIIADPIMNCTCMLLMLLIVSYNNKSTHVKIVSICQKSSLIANKSILNHSESYFIIHIAMYSCYTCYVYVPIMNICILYMSYQLITHIYVACTVVYYCVSCTFVFYLLYTHCNRRTQQYVHHCNCKYYDIAYMCICVICCSYTY